MNIPQKISKDSFPSLWDTVIKEGRETKKNARINRAISIFSQIFFAISVFTFLLKNHKQFTGFRFEKFFQVR